MGCNADRLLTRRCIDDEQRFLRIKKSLQLLKLFDQRDIDFLATGRIEDVDVTASFLVPFKRGGRGTLHVFLAWVRFENWNVDLFAKRRGLLCRRRDLQVEGDQVWASTLVFERWGKMCGRSGFSGSVETDDQNPMRPVEIQRRGVAAEQDRQFVIENLNDLLTGGDAAEDGLAQRLVFDARDEFFRDLKVD